MYSVQHSSRFSSVEDYFCLLGLSYFKGVGYSSDIELHFYKVEGLTGNILKKNGKNIDAAEADIS